MPLRQVHRLVGLAALLVFLGTGATMHFRYDSLRGMTDAARLLFRSTHIYLLYSALLNLALGLYLQDATGPWARRLQQTGSVLILAGPLLALAAFLREPFLGGLQRPFTVPVVVGSLVGMGCHWLAASARDREPNA